LRPGGDAVFRLAEAGRWIVIGLTCTAARTILTRSAAGLHPAGGPDAAAPSRRSPRTRLVWLESPTNPRLLIYDIAAISAAAHAHGALLVVDNTFATPCFQQPFLLGADIVVHSVTKYLAGHSDLIQGAVLAKDVAAFDPIKFLQNATGAVPSPFDCWLTLVASDPSSCGCCGTRRTRSPWRTRSPVTRA
jgi:cystathionine beta-lyase/cystathionine gamma-synthase